MNYETHLGFLYLEVFFKHVSQLKRGLDQIELDVTKGNSSNPYSSWNEVPLEVERLSDQFTKTLGV